MNRLSAILLAEKHRQADRVKTKVSSLAVTFRLQDGSPWGEYGHHESTTENRHLVLELRRRRDGWARHCRCDLGAPVTVATTFYCGDAEWAFTATINEHGTIENVVGRHDGEELDALDIVAAWGSAALTAIEGALHEDWERQCAERARERGDEVRAWSRWDALDMAGITGDEDRDYGEDRS